MFFGPIEYIAIKYRMYGEDFDIDENVNDIVNTILELTAKEVLKNEEFYISINNGRFF